MLTSIVGLNLESFGRGSLDGWSVGCFRRYLLVLRDRGVSFLYVQLLGVEFLFQIPPVCPNISSRDGLDTRGCQGDLFGRGDLTRAGLDRRCCRCSENSGCAWNIMWCVGLPRRCLGGSILPFVVRVPGVTVKVLAVVFVLLRAALVMLEAERGALI